MNHRVHQAKEQYRDSLTMSEKIGVYVTKKVGTMWCAYVFCGIGIGSIIGVVTGNVVLGLIFGAVSSYFLQLVLLPVIMVGQNVESKKNDHVLSEILKDTEEILRVVKGVPISVQNEETGAEIIMPNYVHEQFDQGNVKSLADII